MTGRTQKVIDRDARFAALAETGITATEIASATQERIDTVYRWARASGFTLVRGTSTRANAERQARADKMAGMFRQGVTLAKIGAQFGMTRERVRQIITKVGVAAVDGGASAVARSKRAAVEQAKDAQSLAEFGVPYQVMRQLRRDGVLAAFRAQRKNASNRGVQWMLTFPQWFAIWQSSGKLHLRGRGKGKYVMSRVSDKGCYELGNVHIQLATENSKEAVAKWRGKTKVNRGVFCLYPGREMAWFAKVGKTSLGFYRNEAEAVAARNAFLAANPERQSVGYTTIKSKHRNGGPDTYQVVYGKRYIGSFKTPEAALAARAAYLESLASAQPADAATQSAQPMASHSLQCRPTTACSCLGRGFFDASPRLAMRRPAALRGTGCAGRVHQKGEVFRALHGTNFCPYATGNSTGNSMNFSFEAANGTTCTPPHGPLGWPLHSPCGAGNPGIDVPRGREAGVASTPGALRHTAATCCRGWAVRPSCVGLPRNGRQAITAQSASRAHPGIRGVCGQHAGDAMDRIQSQADRAGGIASNQVSSMTFPAIRPKATPAPCAGIKRPAMTIKRYPGFILENQETGRASTERRKAISKAAV